MSESQVSSTMMDEFPLGVRMIFDHGRRIHPESRVTTWIGGPPRSRTFAETSQRIDRLAASLARLGVGPGTRVGTFMWNGQEHLEAYFAAPCMGAVLHTLNPRLFPEQIAYIVNHAEDRVIIVDATVAPLLAKVAAELATVEHYIVTGAGHADGLGAAGARVHSYDDLLAAEAPGFDWPAVDERSAAAICYTSGTTGNPRGVVYSHRSIALHTLCNASSAALPISQHDRVLTIVPQFHAMAWGVPYLCWLHGADILLPGPYLQAEHLAAMIERERPTMAPGVPTIWNDILHYAEAHPVDFSSLRFVTCGGAALSKSLVDEFGEKHGVPVMQGWGMTETSPIAALSWPPRGTPDDEVNDWYARTGRVVPGVELRIVDEDGTELPWDGSAVGEIEVRGPWVTGCYLHGDAPDAFRDGWLRTGDVGHVLPGGFVEITDRAKDVIKSGGEWISSVALENTLMAHTDVIEAAVVGVPDDKWDERPLACVVLREDADVSAPGLREFLRGRVAKWWLPERWCFVDEIPKTGVGKFDKKLLRQCYRDGELSVVDAAVPPRREDG
jgi:fatty-acyl-CoA synthase